MVHGLFVRNIRQVSLAMLSRHYGEIPLHFDWSMWMDVRSLWCGLMLPVVLWAWPLSLAEFCSLFVMAGVLVLIAIYDMRFGLIYDRLVFLLLMLSVVPLFCGHIALGTALAGAILGGSLFGGLRWLSHGGLGLGDVKLAVPLGVWLGWEDFLLCLLLASVAGLVYGGLMLAFQQMRRQTPLPFGPFLAGGAMVAFGWGGAIRSFFEVWLC